MSSNFNHLAREWTPFSGRPVVDSQSFGLPVNRSVPIPLAPGRSERERSRSDSTDRLRDELSELSIHRSRNTSSPYFGTSPTAINHRSPTPSVWGSSNDGSLIGSPILPNGDLFDIAFGRSPHDIFGEPEPAERPQIALGSLVSNVAVSRGRATILFHGIIGPEEEELVIRLKLFFTVLCVSNTKDAMALLGQNKIDCIVSKLGDGQTVRGVELVKQVRKHPASSRIFIAFFSRTGANDAIAQNACLQSGANMVTDDIDETHTTCVTALKIIGRDPFSVGETYSCPLCSFDGFMEDELCEHVVLFHGGHPNSRDVACPICGVTCKSSRLPFPVHVHKSHGPVGRARQHVPRKQHHTYIFVLIVCQRMSDRRFLMVNEPASWGWWIPGGRVEWGESLQVAAVREALEEAGVEINITGVLKLEYTAGPSRTRERFIFYANPVDDEKTRAKCVPDYQSRGACWVSLDEVNQLPLRGEEPRKWFQYVEDGGQIFPMSLLSIEGEGDSSTH